MARRDVLSAGVAWSAAAGFQLLGPSGSAHAALVDEDVATQVFAEAAPSVVAIAIVKSTDIGEVAEASGSGVAWDGYGHIVTAYRCISRADKSNPRGIRVEVEVEVEVEDEPGSGGGVERYARIIGTDTLHDLAVLQLLPLDEDGASEAAPLDAGGPVGSSSQGQPALPMPRGIKVAGSEPPKVGQSVFALGRTYGAGPAFSAGVVSALNRGVPSPMGTTITGSIQTDASVGAGGSGGPLVDSSGRLVGLAAGSFTRAGSGRSSGVNFALSVSLLRELVPPLIVYGNPLGKRV